MLFTASKKAFGTDAPSFFTKYANLTKSRVVTIGLRTRLDEAGAKTSQDESAEAVEVATASEQATNSQPEAPVAANEVEAVAEAA